MKQLLLGVLLGGGAAIAYGTHVVRGDGTWSYNPTNDSHGVAIEPFEVETLELAYGPWYFELVWGRFR